MEREVQVENENAQLQERKDGEESDILVDEEKINVKGQRRRMTKREERESIKFI